MAGELDVAVEERGVWARGELAVGHARYEGQRVVGFQREAVPYGGAVKAWLARRVDGQLVRYEDHDVSPAGSITMFSKGPRPSMGVRTTSPARRDSPRPAPTPDGVPVGIPSPGSGGTRAPRG